MNSNISTSETPNSEPVIIQKTARERQLAGLRPYKKGENGRVKQKGDLHIKDRVKKKLNKERADNIAEVIIAGAEAGDDKKIDKLLQLTGDLNPAENTTNVQVNNLQLTEEFMDKVRAYLSEKNNDNNTKQITNI